MPEAPRRTLSREGTYQIEVKGSRFLAIARPVADEAEARALHAEQRREHPQARHHVWAARLANPELWQSYDEDGEPAGTAGRPILTLLERSNLVQVAVVVVRYFGGILLGAGGLVRAYTQSAQGALAAAQPVEVRPWSGSGSPVTMPPRPGWKPGCPSGGPGWWRRPTGWRSPGSWSCPGRGGTPFGRPAGAKPWDRPGGAVGRDLGHGLSQEERPPRRSSGAMKEMKTP